MGSVDYAVLIAGLIKPLVTYPEVVVVNVEVNEADVKAVALVHKDDLGRVIGKKGRVAGAIRTLAHAAAIRNKENIEIEFNSLED